MPKPKLKTALEIFFVPVGSGEAFNFGMRLYVPPYVRVRVRPYCCSRLKLCLCGQL